MPHEHAVIAGLDPHQRLLTHAYEELRRAAELRARSRRAAYASHLYMTAAARQVNRHRALQRVRGRSWYRFIRMRGGGTFDHVVAVRFSFPRHLAKEARRVSVVGPFNQWNPEAHPLRKTTEGDWAITIYLRPGRIIYHFDIDGACWLDPNDEGRVPNVWGTHYSVRVLAPNLGQLSAARLPALDTPIRGGAQAVQPIPEPTANQRTVRPPRVDHDGSSWFRPPVHHSALPGETPSFECRMEHRLEACLLHVRGEVDSARVAEFETALSEAAASGRPVILSLRETRHVDVAALNCVDKLRLRLSVRGQRLVVSEPAPSVRREIESAGYHEVLPVFSSMNGALHYLAGSALDEVPARSSRLITPPGSTTETDSV